VAESPTSAPPPRAWWWRAVQLILLLALFAFIAQAIGEQQDKLRDAAAAITVNWWRVAAASAIVLATYAALIQSWRVLMTGWGSSLSYSAAVRTWFIANLGRYIPGKVWSVGALVVLAQREGVSPVAATGAAVLGTLINIGAGFGVVAVTGSVVLDALGDGYRAMAWIGSAVFVVGVVTLPWVLPLVLRFLAARRPTMRMPDRDLSPGAIWLAVAINIASWAGYGAAFMLLSRALLPDVSGALAAFVAIWTASYLVGYLLLIAPGGIGVREGALVAACVALGITGAAEATILAAASRLWLIVLEVLPGLVCLALAPGARRPRS
jgi:glycosyltransferase 2 family protein